MGYVLLALGLALAWLDYLGAQNVRDGFALAQEEIFTGQTPFWKWLGALVIVGAIGYVPDMEPIATGFLVLIMVSVVLSHNSQFSQLISKV